MDAELIYILAGIGVMVGAWVWTKSVVKPAPKKGRKSKEPEAEVSPQRVKAWLGVVAGVLGLLSTATGMLKSCDSEPPKPAVQYGGQCQTDYGVCPMQHVAPVGKACTCFDQFGNFASGNVVQ